MYRINYFKKFRLETEKVKWLPLKQIAKETVIVLIVSILFALFLGGVNLLLQHTFNQLLMG